MLCSGHTVQVEKVLLFVVIVTFPHTRDIGFETSYPATFQSPPPATQSDPGRRVSDLITTGYF